jgi:outer membrane protein
MQARLPLFIPALIFTFFLGGCQNYTRTYSSKNAHTQRKTHKASLPNLKSSQTIDTSQFELSTRDPTLAELIDLGLKNNPQTKVYWDRVKQAKASYGTAQSAFYPQLNAEASANKSKQISGLTDGSYLETLYSASLNLDYTLFDFGERKWVSSEAKKRIAAATHHYDRTLQDVIYSIRDSYYAYLFEQSMLQAKLADRDDALTSYEIALAKYESGVDDKADSSVAKANYMGTISELTKQKKQTDKSMEALLHQIGLPIGNALDLGGFGEINDVSCILENSEVLINLAMQSRPDLKAIHSEIEAQEADVKAKRAGGYPKLSAGASVGYSHYPNSSVKGATYSAGAQLSVPIFQGMRHVYKAKTSEAKLREVQDSLKQKQIDIIRDVLNAEIGLKSASVEVTAATEYLEACCASYEISLAKYKAGTSAILDLIQAQTKLADARAQLASAKRNWFTSMTDLSHAAGVLTNDIIETVPAKAIKTKRPMEPGE